MINFDDPKYKDQTAFVRVHSSCFTGDLLESLLCDCGSQLHKAIDMISKNGRGVIIYLNQEGRGIGLVNKIRSYNLQKDYFDTVQANNILGFGDDMRDFRIAAKILQLLNVNKIKLLSNNPNKLNQLKEAQIEVEELLPLIIEPNEHNKEYLATKVKKLGHRF